MTTKTSLLPRSILGPDIPLVADDQAQVYQEGVDAIEDSFTIDDYTRWRLLEGLDDIAITLSHADDIDAYERQRLPFKPATT